MTRESARLAGLDSLLTIHYAPFLKIIGADLNCDLIQVIDIDVVNSKLATKVSQDHNIILQFYPKQCVGTNLYHCALQLNIVFFSHEYA